MNEEIKDPIVESIVKQFIDRSNKGIEKYGTTLEENDTDDFLEHTKQELMDAILYIEKKQSQIREAKLKLNQMYPGMFEANKPI